MLIYYSMIVWIAFMYLIYKMIALMGMRKKVPLLLAILTMGYIIFWVGIREGIYDTAAYIMIFRGSSSKLGDILSAKSINAKSPGFAVFNILFKCFISQDYHVWLMFIALVTGLCIVLVLQKYSVDFFYSMILFMLTLNFTWMLNGMRQFLVASIMFLCSRWIVEKKWIRYLIIVLLLSTIHYSVLIMIPVYWVVQGKPWNKKTMLFICMILVCSCFVGTFSRGLDVILENTAYSGVVSQFASDDGVNPIRVLVMCVPVVLSLLKRRQIEQIDNKYMYMCVNMSIVTAGLYFLGVFTSGILMGRLPIYFELYNLILIPFLIKNCFNNGIRQIMYLLCTLGYLFYFYLQGGNLIYASFITGWI